MARISSDSILAVARFVYLVVVVEVRVVGKWDGSSGARGEGSGSSSAFQRGFPFVLFRGRVGVTSRSSEIH